MRTVQAHGRTTPDVIGDREMEPMAWLTTPRKSTYAVERILTARGASHSVRC